MGIISLSLHSYGSGHFALLRKASAFGLFNANV